ncbi:sugar-transfer associated ATP-grasp domain-containing protein [Emcibacter sp.]|uniref:sugar-transfer associated ATP-grasp domain-containing protein n=1 Tax=Emcibacter sp. TaxID=1979954 RepID=UPI002AA72090|nr:sugar-transfer associated ATP-grasp domain-containing protein [Emcibacter sp.]
MIWLRITTGINYATYHHARMWRKGISWHYKTGFTSPADYRKLVNRLNRGKYHGVSQYKSLEKAFFNHFNLPTPRYLGTFHEKHGQTAAGADLCTLEEFERFLLPFAGEKLCIKKVVGYGGSGFKAYEISLEGEQVVLKKLSSEESYPAHKVYETLIEENPDGWVVEEYMTQHPIMSRLNPTSVNTIRMYVYEDKSGDIKIIGTRIRIGRAGSLVDNTEAGGFSGNINPETGVVEFLHLTTPAMTEVTHHPDSGEKILGFQIPMWQEVRELGTKSLSYMPETRFLGLDIAISDKGPTMIEMNIEPSMSGLPRCEVPFRHVFEV